MQYRSDLSRGRMSFRLTLRVAKILLLAIRYRLDALVFMIPALRPFRFVRWFLPWNWFQRDKHFDTGTQVRRFLEDAGPLYVKLGQALSTREDLIPSAIITELQRLQDKVPPFDGSIAQTLIESTYDQPIKEAFAHFEIQPLASASIAQVHGARLHSGEEVVVKVLRPGIHQTIKDDLKVLYAIARMVDKRFAESRRLRLVEVVAEYEKTITDELDLSHEAANAAQLKRNFPDSKIVYIPDVYWDYTRRNILVMERIYGVPVNDVETMIAAGVDMKRLGERGVEIFFKQVFFDSFFHADMHPGNIFVDISNPDDPSYISVDFGIVGSLSVEDQRYLAENLLAFFNRDYRRVAELHVESGWVSKDTRIDEFENTIRAVCEPIFNKPLAEISFGHFLLSLFNTARRYEMNVQPQLVLLQKTLLHVEGLGRIIYPELDLWKTAKPILEEWMHDRIGINGLWKKSKRDFPILARELPDVPMRALRLLNQAERGELRVSLSEDDLTRVQTQIERNIQRSKRTKLALTLLGAGLIALATHFFQWQLDAISLGIGMLIAAMALYIL